MKKLYSLLTLVALPFIPTVPCFAAKVEVVDIPSAAMQKSYRAGVVLPDSYTAANNQAAFPVLYLLHGATGHFDDWLNKTPDKMLLQNLSDKFNLIIVTPEGEAFGWYLDSPIKKDNQFETYLTQEVIQKVDNSYRTVRDRKGRVISGFSMGGHGALYLATRHPDLYCAAGSMSGAVDLSSLNGFDAAFATLLGPKATNADSYASNSVMNMVDKMKKNGLPLIIDCGVDDFLTEQNRELHRRLVYNKTPHDYTERPGGHTWDYWQNSLPYQVLFLDKVLKANAAPPAPTP